MLSLISPPSPGSRLNKPSAIFSRRRAGILAHITSLPGPQAAGDLGENAYFFIDFLKRSGCSVWQTLPLGQPHADGSPYQCVSAHAGNTSLICRQQLRDCGWLPDQDEVALEQAYSGFLAHASEQERQDFSDFCHAQVGWLDDFALYQLWKQKFQDRAWHDWPKDYRDRKASLLAKTAITHQAELSNIKFQQFVFFRQWAALKAYANQNGILLFGDIPIFVAYDSADVWAERDNFKLNADGSMPVVAGVPPDYFSETGQRWGNPHFDWGYLQAQGFDWWLRRIEGQLQLFDIVRIDHFRGFEAAWEVPAEEDTAINGSWVPAPGRLFLEKVQQHFGEIGLVAEDLGVITPEVEALRDDFALPGMRILQFGFSDDPDNPHEPHNCVPHSVIYTGTHDNDTTLGWYQQLTVEHKQKVDDYLGEPNVAMPDALINWVLASVSRLAVLPMQDVLALDGEHRMNVPGTIDGNWRWRFDWSQLTEQRIDYLGQRLKVYGRLAD